MPNWRTIPFVRILIPFMLGVYLNTRFPSFDFPIYTLPILGIVVVFLSYLKDFSLRAIFGIFFSSFMLLAGFQRSQLHNELKRVNHFEKHRTTEKDTVLAWVADMPSPKNWIGVKLKVESWNACTECTGNLLVYIEKDSLSSALQYGDRIIFSSKVDTVASAKNPHAFDYQQYLHYQNIHYQAFIRSGDWRLQTGVGGYSFWRKIYQLRLHLLGVLKQHLSEEATLGVGSALILGYRANISNELRTAYADTGAIHVLAVSGLHVGLIYLFASWVLKIIPKKTSTRGLKLVLSLLSIWLFAFLTGSSPSVLRAATMFTFVAIGDYSKRYKNIYNTLATAAFITLLYDPFLLFHIGFQLSYLAVLGIVYFQPKIARWRYFPTKLSRYLWGLLAVSFAAQVVVSPISIYYFHQFPIWFWLSSLLVIPAAFLILLLGTCLFIATPIFPYLADILGIGLDYLIWGMNSCIFKIQALPIGLLKGLWITWEEVLLLYGSIAFIVLWINTKKVRWSLAMLTVFMFYSFSFSYRKVTQLQQREMLVYQVKKETLIDFFVGDNCYTLQSTGLQKQDIAFAAQQHRWAKGAYENQVFTLDEQAAQEQDNWFYDAPFLQFYDTRIALIDHEEFKPTDKLLPVDYLLLHHNPRVNIADLKRIFKFEKVLIDGSNYQKQRKKWKVECEELGIEYHDMALSGAWILQK